MKKQEDRGDRDGKGKRRKGICYGLIEEVEDFETGLYVSLTVKTWNGKLTANL